VGRHAGFDDPAGGVPGRRRGRRLLGGLAALLALALAAAAGVAFVGPDRARELVQDLPLPLTGGSGCDTPVVVRIVAAPSAAPTVGRMLGSLTGASQSDGCVRAVVEPQNPVETIGGAAVLPLDRAPDLWVPDAGFWVGRMSRWPAEKVGTLGSTPLVVATSRTVVEQAGWSGKAPTWAQALGGGRPLAVPSPAQHAESLVALATLWQRLGKGKPADQALVGAELIAARTADLELDQALQLAQADTATAPLVPTTEQSVFALNRAVRSSALTAVYPADGSPVLDYPVLRIVLPAAAAPPRSRVAAVDRVVARLRSADARSVAVADGFRQSPDAGPKAVGVADGPVTVLPSPDAGVLRDVLGRLSALAKPSRMLALVDVSRSMEAQLPGSSATRIELTAAVAAQGVQLLPDQASVGVWVFSGGLDSGRDHDVLANADPLGTLSPDGTTRRQVVLKAIDSVAGRLRSGGTPLYDTVLAGVRALRADYDPDAVNSVVVFTDGANENSRGISLTRLLSTLADELDKDRPIAVFTIGIGPDIDSSALKQISEATGGRSYQVNSPAEIKAALLDGLSTRKPVGSAG
jgi:Ca-activated chloride channel homolog